MLNCLGYLGFKAKMALQKFFTNEQGEVNVVAIVVLIAVAVVLALLLKGQLAELIRTIIGQVTTKASEALEDA